MFSRYFKIAFTGIAGAAFIFSLGCSKGDGDGGGGGESTIPNTNGLAPKNAVRLANPTDYLNHLSQSLDVNWKANPGNIKGDLTNYRAAMAQWGDANFFTNASRLYSNFGYVLCGVSYDQEQPNATSRVVFRFINMNVGPAIGTGTQSEAQVRAFLTHIAVRLWGRAPSAEELSDLLAMYNEHVRLQTVDGSPAAATDRTREVAIYICTAAASSVQSVLRGGKTL